MGAYLVRDPSVPKPPADEGGWVPADHLVICDAYNKFLSSVLDGSSGENLVEGAMKIANSNSLILAKVWCAQKFTRSSLLQALDSFSQNIVQGQKIRLLCHCR